MLVCFGMRAVVLMRDSRLFVWLPVTCIEPRKNIECFSSHQEAPLHGYFPAGTCTCAAAAHEISHLCFEPDPIWVVEHGGRPSWTRTVLASSVNKSKLWVMSEIVWEMPCVLARPCSDSCSSSHDWRNTDVKWHGKSSN